MSTPRTVHLFMTEGSSDKQYNIHLEADGEAWKVRFENGRRGKPLRGGVKGEGLGFEEAEKIFEKLYREKTRKGYTEEEHGIALSSTEFSGQATGFRAQLFNEISAAEAAALGGDWLVQEKYDGERRGIDWEGDRAVYSNRRGLETGLNTLIDADIKRLGEIVGGFRLDAEDMGDHVVIFDVREHFMMGPDAPFFERASVLEHIEKTVYDAGLQDRIRIERPIPLDAFFEMGGEEKLRAANSEGFVIRHRDSVYTPGRPSSGGDALKVKFWEEATCRVIEGRPGKRSVGLELLDGDDLWVFVGNVTVPANQDIPEPGTLVDVKYLYAYEGGSLFEPTLRRARPDVDPSECRLERLKFKRETSPGMEP